MSFTVGTTKLCTAAVARAIPALAAVGSDTSAGWQLGDMLSSHSGIDETLLPQAVTLIEEAGGRWVTRQEAAQNLTCALDILAEALIAESAAAELAVLARFLDRRSH